jgi:hypothetical protein
MLGFAYAPQGDARIEALYPNLRKSLSLPELKAQKERLSTYLITISQFRFSARKWWPASGPGH